LAALLVTGCAVPKSEIGNRKSEIEGNIEHPTPPLPTASYRATQPVERAAVVAPKVLRLEWTKGDTHPETVTQVWQCPEVWVYPPEHQIAQGLGTLFGEFAATTCQVTADQSRMFFIIRNRLGGEYSEWDMKAR
jgi:hypothetical protein